MTDYRVTAVRYKNQELTAVQLGEVGQAGEGGEGREGQWTQEPHETGVAEVVARIEGGDRVHALLRDSGHVDVGPALKVVTDGQGRKSLALDNAPGDCLELADLERF
ncbi:hypothetical protein [Pseudorhodoferax sp.]|uniref:hypothetical protein n=1 Tax=Pseudorhodoferax sp. TaxID=1993553 RepID=UPI002DD69F2F|nr:hypothetical protein [Pseudorhodoferax sp.]